MENPASTFDALQDATNAGLRCSACVLNLEDLFVSAGGSASAQHDADATKPTKTTVSDIRDISWKRKVIDAVDRFLPRIAPLKSTFAPVLYGAGIKQSVIFSNRGFRYRNDPKLDSLKIQIIVRGEDGAEVGRYKDGVPAHSSRIFNVSDFFNDIAPPDTIRSGVIEIKSQFLGEGISGTYRPNIVIEARAGIAAVHFGQPSLVREMFTTWIYSGDHEHHLLLIGNVSDSDYSFTVHCPPHSDTKTYLIPATSSRIVWLDKDFSRNGLEPGSTYMSKVMTDCPKPFLYFLYADTALDALSIDHLG